MGRRWPPGPVQAAADIGKDTAGGRTELIKLSDCASIGGGERAIALYEGRRIDGERFRADVAAWTTVLQRQRHFRYALYHEQAYPFAVLLWASLHAGKEVWIPGNNRPATSEDLLRRDCRLLGEWGGQAWPEPGPAEAALQPLDSHRARLVLFSSGSSGQPKAIDKQLWQLQREVTVLERQWGMLLGSAVAAATVSHQHIYGLLFRVLWPLAAGRCFHSRMYLSPESMLTAAATRAYWIASPAQLKRLDELTGWADFARLRAIFSSGGPLSPAIAEQVEQRSGRQVIEIYGSSETGGIGWRRPAAQVLWTPFPGITLSRTDRERSRLLSPFLPAAVWLDDRIEPGNDGCFKLGGRLDRIVKVEEKRLSLEQMEAYLARSTQVAQAHCLLLPGHRDRIAAVIVATEQGAAELRQDRLGLIRQLRTLLLKAFEAVVLPRQWLFLEALPQTVQGKIDNDLLSRLMRQDRKKFPQLLYCRRQDREVVLELFVRPELLYFDGHFPGQPILAGAVQLAWVEHYGKLFFAIDRPFVTMEVIKFKKIIRPGASIRMALTWNNDSGKLYFEIRSAADAHSSGRMVYGFRS